ncbi:DUF4166 domain-containing protein [Methylobacterium sp. sgz302541]|uniref:SDR family oxidoreductase n=1 Tax=unclassified Methylobacterium TaxID=2615210 RepID=UPI003D329CCD
MRRVVLVGATGVFGSRLAALIAANPRVDLVLAARGRADLAELKAALIAGGARAFIETRTFDRREPGTLAELAPFLVIDAAGPFQTGDYRLALAACACGAHYLDLADGRAFVAGFPAALERAARAAGVLAVTGASSTPALSHAALEPLVAGWRSIDAVTVAISPGARAPRGLSVIRAILSYAGRPVRVFADGEWRRRPGWSGARRLDMPGLGRRWLSLCETPDLDLLPARFPIRREALFLAGLELGVVHLGLAALTLPVRWGWVRSLVPLAPLLRRAADVFALAGSDCGGMIVSAAGLDGEGRRIEARWSLVAAENAGPNVPAAAAAALVRGLADGRETRVGAMACVGLLDRDAILAELSHLPVRTQADERLADEPALFRRLLGRRFDTLPPTVRAVHGATVPTSRTGQAVARLGAGLAARVAASLLGLPKRGRHSLVVEIVPEAGGESWTRRFGAARFASRLVDTGDLGAFEERVGPLRFRFRPEAAGGQLVWHFSSWSLLGLPLPAWSAPRVRARCEEAGGRYRFVVAVAHPWLGPLFAYRGRLDQA